MLGLSLCWRMQRWRGGSWGKPSVIKHWTNHNKHLVNSPSWFNQSNKDVIKDKEINSAVVNQLLLQLDKSGQVCRNKLTKHYRISRFMDVYTCCLTLPHTKMNESALKQSRFQSFRFCFPDVEADFSQAAWLVSFYYSNKFHRHKTRFN